MPFKKGHPTFWTDETRAKVSKSLKGHIGYWKGKEMPKSLKSKLSLIKKGHMVSLETRKKISIANKGNYQSKETKRKISEKLKGRIAWNKGLKGFLAREKSSHWKGGITSINETIRKSLEYKLWRKAIFERDNYICIWCGAKNGQGKTIILHADHIKPFYLFPELRFAIDNGRTLCKDCHKKTDNYGRPTTTKQQKK